MTMPSDLPPPRDDAGPDSPTDPRPLDYHQTGDGTPAPPRFGTALGALIGFGIYFIGGALLVWGLAATRSSWKSCIMAILAFLVGITVVAAYADARLGWRGLIVGIALGIGLTLLIPGICYVVLRSQ